MALIQPMTIARFLISLRPFLIGFLILVFLIPLGMVSDVIRDRIANHQVAIDSISASWAGKQHVFGPVLIVPLTETQSIDYYNPETQKTTVTRKKVETAGFFIPDDLKIDVQWTAEERARGIHRVPVYTAQVSLKGRYDGIDAALKDYQSRNIVAGAPYLSISVSDIRGIGASPRIAMNGKDYAIAPGSKIAGMAGGFHVPLSQGDIDKGDVSLSIDFDLKGISGFSVVPAGRVVEMQGRANWPHPSFKGQFLPDQKTVETGSFAAHWKTGLLATNILEQTAPCIGGNNGACAELTRNSFEVEFFQPVDIYTQSLRAAKYGILFVTLTFAIFYITEITQGTRVYTMQLLLIGAALAIFYLLLTSLSEIIGFGPAYLAASVAIAGLLTYYSSFVLKSRKGGFMVGGIVALLYLVLYFNLSSEDYALLIGSVLLFVALVAIMVITRNIDWTSIGKSEKEPLP